MKIDLKSAEKAVVTAGFGFTGSKIGTYIGTYIGGHIGGTIGSIIGAAAGCTFACYIYDDKKPLTAEDFIRKYRIKFCIFIVSGCVGVYMGGAYGTQLGSVYDFVSDRLTEVDLSSIVGECFQISKIEDVLSACGMDVNSLSDIFFVEKELENILGSNTAKELAKYLTIEQLSRLDEFIGNMIKKMSTKVVEYDLTKYYSQKLLAANQGILLRTDGWIYNEEFVLY
ncbi:MAG: hypothetical protein HEQ33_06795 [Dolichospermum sp. WA123]|nr:hypothetical protein [Dolichospermum sp. WA123]